MFKIKTGVVTNYKVDKNYGFIKDEEDGNSYFFLLDKKEQIDLSRMGHTPISFIRKGDILKFSIRQSLLKPSENEAHNLIFVGNKNLDKLIEQSNKGLPLYGQLKKINDKYYLLDSTRDILLPLKVRHSDHLTNEKIDTFLEKKQITYFIEVRKNPTKVFAKLYNDKTSDIVD